MNEKRVIINVKRKDDVYVTTAKESSICQTRLRGDGFLRRYMTTETKHPTLSARKWRKSHVSKQNYRKSFCKTKILKEGQIDDLRYAQVVRYTVDMYDVDSTHAIAESLRRLLPQCKESNDKDLYDHMKNETFPHMQEYLMKKNIGYYLSPYVDYALIDLDVCRKEMDEAAFVAVERYDLNKLNGEDNKVVSQWKNFVRMYMEGALKKNICSQANMSRYQGHILSTIINSGKDLFKDDPADLIFAAEAVDGNRRSAASDKAIWKLRRALSDEYPLIVQYAGEDAVYAKNFFCSATQDDLKRYGLTLKDKDQFEIHMLDPRGAKLTASIRKIRRALPQIIEDFKAGIPCNYQKAPRQNTRATHKCVFDHTAFLPSM